MSNLLQRLFPGEICTDEYFRRRVNEHLPTVGRVLDLGCGSNTRLSSYRTDRRQVWGVDFQRHPELRHSNWFRLLGPDGSIPFPNHSFDLITSTWVLEHVRIPRVFLKEVSRVLAPGGAFVSQSINGAHYVTWITRLFHALPHEVTQELVWRLYGRRHHDTFPTWYRLNTEPTLKNAAHKAGLTITHLDRSVNPYYFSFSPLLLKLATVTDWLLETLAPGLGRIYFVVVMRKPGPEKPKLGTFPALSRPESMDWATTG